MSSYGGTINSYITYTNSQNGWSSYGAGLFRQSSYQKGGGNRTYTGCAQFDSSGIKNTYKTYYPTSASITLSGREAIGSHSSARTAILAVGNGYYGGGQPSRITASSYTVNGGSGSSTTISIPTSWIDTFCSQSNPCIILGDYSQGPDYLGFTGVTLNINWAIRYTACSAPTSLSLSETRGKPDTSLTLSWSGAKAGTQNSINGYDIQCSENGEGWWDYGSVSTSSTSGSYTVYFHATRGGNRRWRVRTKGSAGSSYYSGWSSASAYCYANRLPSLSTCSASQTILPSGSSSISTKLTLAGSDSDGQSVSFWWGTKSDHSDEKQVSNNSSVTVSAGTYYCYPWDGIEYGSAKTITFKANTKPSISAITATGTKDTSKNTTYPFAKSLSLSLTANKSSNLSYTWEYKKATTSAGLSSASWTSLSTDAEPTINFSSLIDETYYYTIRAKITETIETLTDTSDYYQIANGYRVPSSINKDLIVLSDLFAPISTNYHDEEGNIITESRDYFSNTLSFKHSQSLGHYNDDTSLTIPKINKISLYYGLESNNVNTEFYNITDNTTEYTLPLNFVSQVNTPIYFKLKFTDYFGVIYENTEPIIITYVSGPRFGTGSNIVMNPSSLKPLSYGSIININFTKEASIWTDTLSNTYINNDYLNERYKFYIYLPTSSILSGQTNQITIPTDYINFSVPSGGQLGDTISLTFSNSINNYIKEQIQTKTGNINTEYLCSITVQANDYFNLSANLTLQNYKIDFKEAPTFNTTNHSDFYIQFKYSDDESSKSAYLAGNDGTNLININETVRFHFPKATDLNNDIVKYSIYAWRANTWFNNVSGASTKDNYILLQDIPVLINGSANPNLKSSEISNHYYYDVQVPISYNYNQFVSYAVQVTDSNNLTSDFMYFGYSEGGAEKPIMIQICRVSNPSINLIRYISEKVGDNKYSVLVDSTISDIGGTMYQTSTSAFSNYGDARNFERSFFSDINSLTITVQMADLTDLDFTNPINYSSKVYNSSTPYPYSESTKISITPSSASEEITLDSNKYIRLLIEIVYGKTGNGATDYRKVSFYSSTSIFYVETATMSYRKNVIGINDESVSANDSKVLSVKNIANKKDIVFEGLDNNVTRRTVIDLVTGEITKTNLSDSVSLCGIKTFEVTLPMDAETTTYTLQSNDFIGHSAIFVNINYPELNSMTVEEASAIVKTYRDADLLDGGSAVANEIKLNVNGTAPETAIDIPLVVTVVR